jgi:NAD-dependent dihydropyrimidine dehydrogenase PreA subunit
VLFTPISLGFMLMGRFLFAKSFYASTDCTACALCAENCPVGAIRMRGGASCKTPWWTFECLSCMRCMNICPVKAIETSYPLAVAYIVLFSAPYAWLVVEALQTLIPEISASAQLLNGLLGILQNLLGLALIYPLAYLLLRIKHLNRILTWLTPTHYYRRYHAPGVKLNEVD